MPTTDSAGWVMAAADSGVERPAGQGRQLDAEEGVGVLQGVGHGAGNARLDQGLAGLPVEAAHGGHEDRQRLLVLAGGVGLEGGPRLLEKRLGPRHGEEGRLQEDEGVHELGTVQGHLQGDGAAAGVAGDVGAGHIEVLEERRRVNDVIGDVHRRRACACSRPSRACGIGSGGSGRRALVRTGTAESRLSARG